MGSKVAKKTTKLEPVWSGAEELRGQLVDIKSLTPDPRNARRHPGPNMAAIKRSLGKFGQVKSIVVRDGVVVAGNGLIQAAESLGWSHIAAVEFGRSEADAAEFGVIDNRSAELAEWDVPQLAELLEGLQADAARDILDAGFSEDDLGELLASMATPDLPEDSAGVDGDGEPPHRFKSVAFTAEQWETILRAIRSVREGPEGGTEEDLPNGRCIELALADWMAGR